MSNNGKKKIKDNDEVEQLLQAAQDEMLLKLSVDSHISHISSNYLDADLDRRFQILKSRPSGTPPPAQSTASQSQPQSQSQSQPRSHADIDVDDKLKNVLGADLSARFAALKASNNNKNIGVVGGPNMSVNDIDDDDNEEDEVEKLIRWAKDAARLDPSPPSDDDDEGKDSDNNPESDDDDDDDEKPRRNKEHRK